MHEKSNWRVWEFRKLFSKGAQGYENRYFHWFICITVMVKCVPSETCFLKLVLLLAFSLPHFDAYNCIAKYSQIQSWLKRLNTCSSL